MVVAAGFGAFAALGLAAEAGDVERGARELFDGVAFAVGEVEDAVGGPLDGEGDAARGVCDMPLVAQVCAVSGLAGRLPRAKPSGSLGSARGLFARAVDGRHAQRDDARFLFVGEGEQVIFAGELGSTDVSVPWALAGLGA